MKRRSLFKIIARGVLNGRVEKIHSNYRIPISNAAAGLLVLENRT